jgi:hypothetical protein
MVDIRTLTETAAINVQVRFALADVNNSPILPFSTIWPFGTTGEALTVKVRRTSDPLSSPTEDVLVVDSGKVFPWDVFTSANFAIECAFQNFIGGATVEAVWVEVIATRVADIGARSRIEGWGIIQKNAFVPFTNAAGGVSLLDGRADRRQFIIVNTSTTGNLFINFGAVPSAGPPPQAVIVLPKNGFFSYESPTGGWTGNVFGVWDTAADGGALVTSGVYGTPNLTTF